MSLIAKKAGKALFEKHIRDYEPADPLYETYTNTRGKIKRRKRVLPPGLSKRDKLVLQSVNKRAHYLDKGINLCGFRVGWAFFIGVIPGAGDVVNIGLNYCLVVRKATQADLPSWLVRRMMINNALSAIVGLVPIVGDVCIAVFKTNSRNAVMLEEYLRLRGEGNLEAERERDQNEQSSPGNNASLKAPKASSSKRCRLLQRRKEEPSNTEQDALNCS